MSSISDGQTMNFGVDRPRKKVRSSWFSFEGRIPRSEFIVQTIVSLLVTAFVAPLAYFVMVAVHRLLGTSLMLIIGATFCVNQFSATIRRLHDFGLPGWFSVANLFPGINLGVFGALAMMPGNRGPNKYGHNPVETGYDILRHGMALECEEDWAAAFECYRYVYEADQFGPRAHSMALEQIRLLHERLEISRNGW